MKNLHLFSLALVLSALIYSCKEEPPVTPPNQNPPAKTKKELITLKNWKISSLISSATDIWNTPLVDACNKDNQYRFRTDDSLRLYDKTLKCNGSDPDSSISNYKLYNNNTQLILNVNLTNSITLNDTTDILELSETTLKIDAEYSGLPATITFIHP